MLLIPFWIPCIIILSYIVIYLVSGRINYRSFLFLFCEFAVLVILPFLFWLFASENDCCHGSLFAALFAPKHAFSTFILIVLCIITYYYSSYRKKLATPILEVLVNTVLVIAIVLNVFIAIQINDIELALPGNLPIVCLYVLALANNQRAFIKYASHNKATRSRMEKICWSILQSKPLLKFPFLLVLCLPVLLLISSFLLLLGQEPDAFIRAFTEAYDRGLSGAAFNCQGDNQPCGGGHYLCTIAANGHKGVVKPVRLGIRKGMPIICNRQLLIANAFEELLQEKFPGLHQFIRKKYDVVGDFIHRYYGIFKHKLISDLIYLLMKPLELFFVLALYTLDLKPENRIARQYLSKEDKEAIKNSKNDIMA
ncbi:DUF6688 domain-containing protein [Foetidibacter luteolus]|uniref:DUF6688 domain-containing protein n=1 Tax=Foetidibacter luteolus TaxID=2608880 RepID=UPI00129BDE19|nr:DUF6688 family protein [Foetidibacter luteolus]